MAELSLRHTPSFLQRPLGKFAVKRLDLRGIVTTHDRLFF